MVAALIKFIQGLTVGGDGQALIGSVGTAVVINNVDNTDIEEWWIDLLYVEPTSVLGPITPGAPVSLGHALGPTPSANFNPDIPGSYRVRILVRDIVGNTDTDIRVFSVPLANGAILPPYQDDPRPLPSIASGLPGAKPNEMNFNGQLYGWSGDSSPSRKLLNQQIRDADASLNKVKINSSDIIAGYLNDKLIPGEGLRKTTIDPSSIESLQLDLPEFQHDPYVWTSYLAPQVGYGLTLHPVTMCAPCMVTSDGNSIWVSNWAPTSGFYNQRAGRKNNVSRGPNPVGYANPWLNEQHNWPVGREQSPEDFNYPWRYTFGALYDAVADRMLLIRSTWNDGGTHELHIVEYSTDFPAVEGVATLTNITGDVPVRYINDAYIAAGYLWIWTISASYQGQVQRCSLSDLSTFTVVGTYNLIKTSQLAYDPDDHYGDGEGRFWFLANSGSHLYSVVPSTGVVTLERNFGSVPLYDGTTLLQPVFSIGYDSDRGRLWLYGVGNGPDHPSGAHGAVSFDVNPLLSNPRFAWVDNASPGDGPLSYGTAIYIPDVPGRPYGGEFWAAGMGGFYTTAVDRFIDDGITVTYQARIHTHIGPGAPATSLQRLATFGDWVYLTSTTGGSIGSGSADLIVESSSDSAGIVAFRLDNPNPYIDPERVIFGIGRVDWSRTAWAGGDLSPDQYIPNYTRVTGLSLPGVQGSVLYHNGTGWIYLPPGTNGHALITHGAGVDPSWATVFTAVIDHSLSSGTNNDVNPTDWIGAGVVRFDSPAAADITGLTAILATDVLQRKIYNIGSFNITLKHQDAGSVAANRLIIPGYADLIIAPDDVVDLFYDITTARWRVG